MWAPEDIEEMSALHQSFQYVLIIFFKFLQPYSQCACFFTLAGQTVHNQFCIIMSWGLIFTALLSSSPINYSEC